MKKLTMTDLLFISAALKTEIGEHSKAERDLEQQGLQKTAEFHTKKWIEGMGVLSKINIEVEKRIQKINKNKQRG